MADKITNKKAVLDNSIIENLMEHQLIDLIHELPDPDTILRKAGIDHLVYDEILADAHVIGEVRSVYAGMVGLNHEIVSGDESSVAQKARDLCVGIFDKRPDPSMSWKDLHWSIGCAPLRGRRLHHVSWIVDKGHLVPDEIFDLPNSGFAFNYKGEALIRTKENPNGEIAEPYRWIATRHMSTRQNPYGIALLSSCFWPWMFKNGGFKFFVKLCEKWGIPHPVGKYPTGTPEHEIEQIVEQLAQLVEDAAGAVPEGTEINLLEAKSGGEPPQERLVRVCNSEMSKALTSQTLTTEINDGGSHAAAKTHAEKSSKNLIADRTFIAEFFDQLFAWITELNYGKNVEPPKWVFKDKKELNIGDVNFLAGAAKLVPVKVESIYKTLGLDQPGDSDEVIFFGDQQDNDEEPDKSKSQFSQFSKQSRFTPVDEAMSDFLDQIKQQLDDAENLEEAKAILIQKMPELKDSGLDELLKKEFELEFASGMADEIDSYRK